MNLTLVISDNCQVCARDVVSLEAQLPGIDTLILDKSEVQAIGIQITHALFTNNELFSYRDIV